MKKGIVINEKVMINNAVELTYYLSESGLLLLPLVENMIKWGNSHLSCSE